MQTFFFQEGSKCSNGRIKAKYEENSKNQKGVKGGDFEKKNFFFENFLKITIILNFWYFSQKCLEIP